jgi:hypothetical protein
MSNPSILKNWLDDVVGNFNPRLWVKQIGISLRNENFSSSSTQ